MLLKSGKSLSFLYVYQKGKDKTMEHSTSKYNKDAIMDMSSRNTIRLYYVKSLSKKLINFGLVLVLKYKCIYVPNISLSIK